MAQQPQLPPPETLSFEAAADELDAIVRRIDSGELELEQMMTEHARGQALVRRCGQLLEDAEQQLKSVDVDDIEGT